MAVKSHGTIKVFLGKMYYNNTLGAKGDGRSSLEEQGKCTHEHLQQPKSHWSLLHITIRLRIHQITESYSILSSKSRLLGEGAYRKNYDLWGPM